MANTLRQTRRHFYICPACTNTTATNSHPKKLRCFLCDSPMLEVSRDQYLHPWEHFPGFDYPLTPTRLYPSQD